MGPLELVGGALSLDRSAFVALLDGDGGLRLGLWVVFLAGISSAIGQSIVLFASQVSPRRFAASLGLSGVIYVGAFSFWTISIWLVGRLIYGVDQPVLGVLPAVGLAYAPQLFSFFLLVPYLGSGISIAVSIWNLLAVVVAVQATFGVAIGPALVCSAAGWLLYQLAQRTIGRPLTRMTRWARSVVAGTDLRSIEDLFGRGGGRT